MAEDGSTTPQDIAEAGAAQPVAEQRPAGVITRELADAKNAEIGEAYSSLMDKMDASRAEQGDFFVPVRVSYDTDEYDDREIPKSEKDERIYILRTAAIDPENPEKKFVIGVSRKGFMIVNNTDSGRGANEGVEEEIARIADGNIPLQVGPMGELRSNEDEIVNLQIHKILDTGKDERMTKLWESAVKRSVASAEAPHKARHETAQREIDLASSAAALFDSLPPRE